MLWSVLQKMLYILSLKKAWSFCLACDKSRWRWDMDIAFLGATAALTMSSFCHKVSLSFTIPKNTILGSRIDHGIFMSAMHVSPELDLNLTDCYIYVRCSRLLQFFYLIPYNLGSLYLVHALIMVYSCRPCMCHLRLTSI